MFPPIVPHLLRGDLTQMPNFVQHMPCKLKRQAFFSAQDTQSEGNVHNRPETHNLRPRAVAGIWQQSAYEPICTLFHTGQQWLTSTDEGFLHTHLPMFWEGGGGQSSVEHHCCQRLRLRARNIQIASREPITADA